MDKNEILEKSRKENKGNDEMAKQIRTKAMSIAFIVGFLVSGLFYLVDALILDTGLIGTTANLIYLTLLFTEGLALGILEKNKKLMILSIVGEVILVIYIAGFLLSQIF